MKILQPNYTQTPNDLFDHWLPHLNESELKVLLVIIRKTFGYHKIKDIISISQLEKITGLSRSNILKARESLQQKGIILREVSGKLGSEQTFYELQVEDSNNSDQYCCDTPPSPDPVPPPVLQQYPQNKLSKETYKQQQQKENVAAALRSEKLNNLLNLLPFSEDEKNYFSKNFDENQISHAVQFYKAKLEIKSDFKPDGSWIAFLTAAVKNMWPIPCKPEKSTQAENLPNIEENKSKAKTIFKNIQEILLNMTEYEDINIYEDRVEYRERKKHIFRRVFFMSRDFDNEIKLLERDLKHTRRN